MNATTKAFHDHIKQAYIVQKAYNEYGPDAAIVALQVMSDMTLSLYNHILAEKKEREKPGQP